jgi:hypothetical protein
MLPTDNPYGAPTTYPPTDLSSGLAGQFDRDQKTGRWSAVSGLAPSAYSPAMTSNTVSPPHSAGLSHQSWGNAPPGWYAPHQHQQQGVYGGPYATPPIAELPPQEPGPVFEMDAGQHQPAHGAQYVELSGSLPPQQHPGYRR